MKHPAGLGCQSATNPRWRSGSDIRAGVGPALKHSAGARMTSFEAPRGRSDVRGLVRRPSWRINLSRTSSPSQPTEPGCTATHRAPLIANTISSTHESHLDELRRKIVCEAIVEECQFRRWNLLALHVRSNHVHLVVTADREPEFVMRSCKAHASKRLNEAGLDDSDRKRWTRHGSTRYLWSEDAVVAAVDYTLNHQREPMAVYAGRSPSASEG